MPTGYEVDFYHDVRQIKLSMGEINQSLQALVRILRIKYDIDDSVLK